MVLTRLLAVLANLYILTLAITMIYLTQVAFGNVSACTQMDDYYSSGVFLISSAHVAMKSHDVASGRCG